jgi:tRNA threonylcarbamoyl adenosine modification protein (Sua5/YciO/YrdC/YwlC family)
MSQIFDLTDAFSDGELEAAVSAAVAVVGNGGLVVIPTDTSYALICDAFNPEAIALLRKAKSQDQSVAIPVGAGNRATIDGIASFSELGNDLASAFWPGPLTVITQSQPSVLLAVKDEDSALPVRIPDHPIAIAVLNAIGPVAMTGAQLAGQEPVSTIEQAKTAIGDAATIYIDGGQLRGTQSNVVVATGENLRLVRAGALTLEQLRAVVPTVIDATASSKN